MRTHRRTPYPHAWNYRIHLNLLNTLEMASLFVYLFSDAQRHACRKLVWFGVVVKIKDLIIAACAVAVPVSSCARRRRAARLLTVTVEIVLLTAIGAAICRFEKRSSQQGCANTPGCESTPEEGIRSHNIHYHYDYERRRLQLPLADILGNSVFRTLQG